MEKTRRGRLGLDKLGMALSIGCLIHCTLLPMLLPVLPALGFAFGNDEMFHAVAFCVILFVGMISFFIGMGKHGNGKPVLIGTIGMLVLGSATFIPFIGGLKVINHSFATKVTIVGSLIIIFAHYLNHKYSCKCSHHK